MRSAINMMRSAATVSALNVKQIIYIMKAACCVFVLVQTERDMQKEIVKHAHWTNPRRSMCGDSKSKAF